jgi:DNA polymerase-4
MDRHIVHVDMDEFFAAVEKLDRPELRGKCLLIGGAATGRGVVSTASYEARKYGCHSAMPMAQAMRLCPQALVLPVRGRRYRELSDRVFAVLERFSPLIEPLSIDEAFLDLTGTERLFGQPADAARAIKVAIREGTGLTCSVGAAPNKFLAKLASDLEKPDGLTVITPDNLHDVLDPLPIGKLWGLGPAAERRFHRLGVRTVGELRRMDDEFVRRVFGSAGEHFQRLANGLDERVVTPDSRAKSVGQEQTFALDIDQPDELRRVLLQQTEQVGRRLRRHRLAARTVTLKLRHGDFTTLTRSETLDAATDVNHELWAAAGAIFDNWVKREFHPLRLLGMTASQLVPAGGGQLDLFASPDRDRQRKLDAAMDAIVDRFGDRAVRRGD